MSMRDDKTYEQLVLENEILTFEVSQLLEALDHMGYEKKALKDIAVRHLAALEEAQSETRALRDSVRVLTADVAHYAQFGPVPPLFPKVVGSG